MLMKRLELNNFRQYYGKQAVVFSDDPEKNVTLILGKNTSGKTTLIQAFRWVLYNDCNFTGKKSDEKAVLNTDVRKAMRAGDEEEARVTLTFVHKNTTYDLTRWYLYRCKTSGDGYLADQRSMLYMYDENGEKTVPEHSSSKMDEILPESLAEYFFFDGEKIAQSRKPEKVKDSINTIMGLVPLEHMISHISRGRYCVENVLRSMMKSDSGIEAINRSINNKKTELSRAEDNKDEAHNRYSDAANRAENKRVELEKVKDLAEYARELKEVDLKLESANKRLPNIETDIIKSFLPAITESLCNITSSDILQNLAEIHYEDKGIPGINGSAIQYLLDSGKCLCGSDLSSHEECRLKLKELLTFLPPKSLGMQISDLKKDLGGLRYEHSRQDNYAALYANYCDQLENIEDLTHRRDFLLSKVEGHRDADIIKKDYEMAIQQRDAFQADEVRYESQIQRIKKEIQGLEHDLETAARTDGFNQEILCKLGYVYALLDKARDQYESNSEGIFEEIETTLKEVFDSMYHGSRTIEMTYDYKVRLTVGGEHLDNSKGLDTVQNFAFIASLLKVAKNRANLELSAEAYPLAMDAVFSNTDEGHIRNICKELPRLAEQAILAIMEKDWDVASSTLDKYVGRKYEINKISETHSELREVM